jgi:hypothetical protein
MNFRQWNEQGEMISFISVFIEKESARFSISWKEFSLLSSDWNSARRGKLYFCNMVSTGSLNTLLILVILGQTSGRCVVEEFSIESTAIIIFISRI